MLTTVLDLTDPEVWTRPDVYDVIAAQRERAAVYRHDTVDEGPLWAVLSHAEAVAVLGDARFSSARGSLLGTGPHTPPAGAGKMMALTDGARHPQVRDMVAPFFSARHLAGLRARVRDLAAAVVGAAVARGDVDAVADLGSVVPLTVICELMGVPVDDRADVVRMCDGAFLGRSPAERRDAHQRLIPYLFGLAMRRRARPEGDLISVLATGRIDGALLGPEEVVLNCDNIIVGGLQTVRHTIVMAVKALIEHPAAWADLSRGAAEPDSAVAELLRFTSVGLHTLRTATADVDLAGLPVRAGDRVVVWIAAANRDPQVFTDPDRLDLARTPNRHLALGWGPHYCVGAGLARLELGAVLGQLATQVARMERTGEPVWNQSLINFGMDTFPVRLYPRT